MLASGRGFASDNNSGVCPEVMEALRKCNIGHVVAYGDDPHTAAAEAKFKEHLGPAARVFFVFGGTGANVTGLLAASRPYQAVICAETAHINADECGAPERFCGCKLLTVATPDGKLTPEGIARHLHGFGVEHHSQPKVVSITQLSEMGTAYTPAEISAIADLAHGHGMLLHVDGARIANAAAGLGVGLRAITADTGVDVVSFGGTKNGLAFGEAVVFLNPQLGGDFKFIRKQSAQLPSKTRFVACQFDALLTDDLWLSNARRANEMAQRLAERVAEVPGVAITQRVEGNEVLARMPRESVEPLAAKSFFYVWDEGGEGDPVVRWVASFDTTEQDVDEFVGLLRSVCTR